MPKIYLLLSRTDTFFARAMHGINKNRYSHVSIALHRELTQMYSFARWYENSPLPAGFIREHLHQGVYGRCNNADSLVMELTVSEEAYRFIADRLMKMEQHQYKYSYDLFGVMLSALGIAHQRKDKYICSQFVAQTLQDAGALTFPRHVSLIRPQDFASAYPLKVVYQGPLGFADRVSKDTADIA